MLQSVTTRDYKLSVTVASCYINVVFLVTVCIIIKDYHGNRELYKFAQLLPQARYFCAYKF